MRLLAVLILLVILFGCKRADLSDENSAKQKPLTDYPYTYIDSESRYTDSAGLNVIIQNSVPKGLSYTDPTGKHFEGRIFWTRVINETATPLELTINFPVDSFPSKSSAGSYLKVFLPLDTMTLDKESLYAYGVTGLKSFLDTDVHKPGMLHRTIDPQEDCSFYMGVLFNHGGVWRAELVIKGLNLLYSIRGSPELDATLIPCGQILKNQDGS